MNIFEKLMTARAELKKRNMKKSGKNQHTGIKYFDLSDILPHTTELEEKLKMLSVVSFGTDTATLTVYNVEKPDDHIVFASPMSTAELKGCHAVQNLGAVETYIRRYLYITAYEIVESETLDKTMNTNGGQSKKAKNAARNAYRKVERKRY